jgi:hypothetical protein
MVAYCTAVLTLHRHLVRAPHLRTADDPVPAQTAVDWWLAAAYRCPCGYTAKTAGNFDRHLDTTDGTEPEHFEVLDGWSLEQVRQWQESAG